MGAIGTIRGLSVATLAVGLFVGAAGTAQADDCVRLGGAIIAGECRVSASVSRSDSTAPGGPYTLDETLRVTSTGKITIPKTPNPQSLTINITGGLIMEVGAQIIGDAGADPNRSEEIAAAITINATSNMLLAGSGANGARISSEQQAGSCNGGRAGNITLTSSAGNIDTEDGSVISANAAKCPAGDIVITTSAPGLIDIDGKVLSQSGLTGTGAVQRPGGGRITIVAGCALIISETGVVSSKGLDPGADLVHLQGCTVLINGLVESTGAGHAIPDSPPNHCNLDPAGHPIGSRSTAFTGCVEVWSGTTLTIVNDNSGNNGEVNADIGTTGGSQGRGWIDLFARGDISITGNKTATWAVHANGGLAQNTDDGGLVTVKSSAGKVLTFAKAIQANSTSAGGIGGDVIVEASQNIEFGTASIQAMGSGSGGVSAGGHITAQSFHGAINGVAPGELNAFPAASGTVTLTACLTDPATSYTGTVIGVRTDNAGACPAGDPVIPAGVPLGTCTDACGTSLPGDCLKASVTSVLNPLTGRFPGNKGPDVLVRLDLGQTVQNAVNTATDSNGDGFIIVLVVKDNTGLLGGSTTENIVVSNAYPKRFALLACSVTIKAADKALAAGRIAAGASSPAGSAENIFVMDLHGAGSNWSGWYVQGDRRYLRNVANTGNAVGVWFLGSNNTFHNGNANDNKGDGILVNGNGNVIDSSDAFGNGGNGVTVVGSSNKVLKVDSGDKGKGNGGDGVKVTGASNTVQEASAFSNGGNGVVVNGNSNTLLKNDAGDKGKGNGGDGLKVVGSGNKVQENDAFANGGDGFDVSGGSNTYAKNTSGDRADKANGGAGFRLSGGGSVTENQAFGNLGGGFLFLTNGFTLSKNVSGNTGSGYANSGFQYRFTVAGNVNGGGNKSNNVTLVGTPFAAGDK